MKIKICTEAKPYSEDRDNVNVCWQHSKVIEIGDQENGYPCGDIQRMKCLNCGVEWDEELPQ